MPPILAHSSVMARISDWAIREAFLLRESGMAVNYSARVYHIILMKEPFILRIAIKHNYGIGLYYGIRYD